MKNIKTIFIKTIFEVLISVAIFGFGFYVLNVGLFFNNRIITFLFAILLILALFALNLLKEKMTSK